MNIPPIQIPLNITSLRASFGGSAPFVAGETAGDLSPGSQLREDEKTLNALAQTAILTNHILADYTDDVTQTPDEWMTDAKGNSSLIYHHLS